MSLRFSQSVKEDQVWQKVWSVKQTWRDYQLKAGSESRTSEEEKRIWLKLKSFKTSSRPHRASTWRDPTSKRHRFASRETGKLQLPTSLMECLSFQALSVFQEVKVLITTRQLNSQEMHHCLGKNLVQTVLSKPRIPFKQISAFKTVPLTWHLVQAVFSKDYEAKLSSLTMRT